MLTLPDVLPVLIEGDPRLRERAISVGELIDQELRRELHRVAATLAALRRSHGFGRALAAPQVGISRRAIAIDLGVGPFLVLDPEVVWASDDTFEVWDDCFSVPDRVARVRRHRSISLRFRDEELRERRWERLPEDLAELLQHELDHLDGVLMVDRAIELRPASERAGLVDAVRPAHRLSLDQIAPLHVSSDP